MTAKARAALTFFHNGKKLGGRWIAPAEFYFYIVYEKVVS